MWGKKRRYGSGQVSLLEDEELVNGARGVHRGAEVTDGERGNYSGPN